MAVSVTCENCNGVPNKYEFFTDSESDVALLPTLTKKASSSLENNALANITPVLGSMCVVATNDGSALAYALCGTGWELIGSGSSGGGGSGDDTIAKTALAKANEALTTAEEAKTTADGLSDSIDTANTNASAAVTTANEAAAAVADLEARIATDTEADAVLDEVIPDSDVATDAEVASVIDSALS